MEELNQHENQTFSPHIPRYQAKSRPHSLSDKSSNNRQGNKAFLQPLNYENLMEKWRQGGGGKRGSARQRDEAERDRFCPRKEAVTEAWRANKRKIECDSSLLYLINEVPFYISLAIIRWT